ncbi:MAG: NAD(P)/FAD-dependent oxidoreductase, partial [Lachnospiraceae bacterium]|nr:NAD(P)/FAD-dependent oxidoreductase [Lachnospiraceae bacterium]
YSRCIMHHYLAGKRNMEQLNFAEDNFAELYNIHWMKGRECVGVEPYKKKVILENGEEVTYDKLLIATGAKTTLPSVENLDRAKNVVGFRNIEDANRLKEAVKTRKHILVIGAGLAGIDCVSGLLEAGGMPTIVEREGWMMIYQLDEKAAATYQEAFDKRGVKQFYGVTVEEVILNEADEITEVKLSNGQILPCDFIIVTTGVRANVDFLKGSGIEVNQFGLLYDDMGMTSEEDVYGAGDVSGMNPIWPTAVKEGIVAASNMVGIEAELVDFFVSKATMNFLGIPCMSLGVVNPYGHHYKVETRELPGSYKKIVHKDGKIEGAVLQGDLSYCGVLQQLIALRVDVSKVSKPLFDIDYSDFFNIEKNFEFYFEDEWL